MNLLHVLPFDPRRSDSGGHVRIRATASHLAARWTVHLVHLEEDDVVDQDVPFEAVVTGLRDDRRVGRLRARSRSIGRIQRASSLLKLLLGFQIVPHLVPQSRVAAGVLRSAAARCDVAVVEFSQLARWRPVDTPSVLVLHDLMWVKHARYAARRTSGGGWRARLDARRISLEARVLSRVEPALAAEFDAVVVVSDGDARTLESKLRTVRSSTPVFVSPNGVDAERFALVGGPLPDGVVAFVGGLDHSPNVDAVRCLVDEVVPIVGDVLREVLVAGRHTETIRAGRVRGLGSVGDVRSVYGAATITVAPIRWGSGTRMKIIEAAACGRVTVAFPEAAEGLDDLIDVGAVVLVTSPSEMADSIRTLLGDRSRCRSLGEAGRQVVAAHYDWHDTLRGLDDAIAHVLTVAKSHSRSSA